jgi:hypothetical protein
MTRLKRLVVRSDQKSVEDAPEEMMLMQRN